MSFPSFHCRHDPNWLALTLEALRHTGCAVVEGVLDADFLEATRAALYRAQAAILREVGRERLERAGELGVLRLVLKFEDHFFRYLEIPEVLEVVDATIGETAILHLQNGFILPPFPPGTTPPVFQNQFHRDFPRVLGGHLMSVNLMFAVDPFTTDNGATLVVPGTHQRASASDPAFLFRSAIPAICGAGGMLVFDSTLYHAAGANASGRDRLAINHQFTRSYLKQQIDYVRALGEEVLVRQKPRTQQLLGCYTRVVTSLNEYYRPEGERLYRKGQG